MLRAVIFDMDGVIFDSIPFVRESFLKSYPGITEEIHAQIFLGNFHEEVAKYAHLKKQETEEERLKRYKEYGEAKAQSRVFDGMNEVIQALKEQGCIVVLNTNAYRNNTLPLLERSGLGHLFDMVADAETSKSKVEKFELIEKTYGLKKEEVIFVTDTVGDVREAEVAGVPTIGVTWGMHNEANFKQSGCGNLIAIVHSPKELKEVLSQ